MRKALCVCVLCSRAISFERGVALGETGFSLSLYIKSEMVE